MKKDSTWLLILGSTGWIACAIMLVWLESIDLALVSNILAKHLVFFLPGVTIMSLLALWVVAYFGAQTSGFSWRLTTFSITTMLSIAFSYSLVMNLWLCEGFTHLEYARGLTVVIAFSAILYVIMKGEKNEK